MFSGIPYVPFVIQVHIHMIRVERRKSIESNKKNKKRFIYIYLRNIKNKETETNGI